MRTSRAASALLVLVILVTGCSHHDRAAASRPTPPPEGSTWTPLHSGVRVSAVPKPLVGEASIDAVAASAVAGPSLLDGEQYVLAVAQLLTDTGPGLSGEEILSQVAASSIDPATRAYVVDDLDGLHKLGWDRRLDTRLEMWIRSKPTGPLNAPLRMSVELVSNITSTSLGMHSWSRDRYDVVREAGSWKLVVAAMGVSGPFTSHNLTLRQQRELLGKGPGWRRIPPAPSR